METYMLFAIATLILVVAIGYAISLIQNSKLEPEPEPKEEIQPGTIIELKNGNFLVKAKVGYVNKNGFIFTLDEYIAMNCQFSTREEAEKARDKYIIFY
ncbi:MAG: hypothetical protein EOL97_12605 [Spirochaetia bacterium]|nr:hypothetical protein [Spirochaetia bacterium]